MNAEAQIFCFLKPCSWPLDFTVLLESSEDSRGKNHAWDDCWKMINTVSDWTKISHLGWGPSVYGGEKDRFQGIQILGDY